MSSSSTTTTTSWATRARSFCRIFIALVWAAARARTQRTGFKRPVYFVIDEASWVIANDTKVATIIRQCRAQNIAMIFAHQDLQSIKDEDVKVTLANCAIKLGAPTGETDKVAPRINADPDVLRGLKQGQFALSVLTDPAVVVEVPLVITKHGSFIDQPTLSYMEYYEILERSQEKYCYVPTPHMAHTPEPEPEPEPEPKPKANTRPPLDDEYDHRYDILESITVNPIKAKAGFVLTVTLPYPRGRTHQQNIPPGTQNGYRFCVKGASSVRRPDNRNGNYWVELEIAQMPGAKVTGPKVANAKAAGAKKEDQRETF